MDTTTITACLGAALADTEERLGHTRLDALLVHSWAQWVGWQDAAEEESSWRAISINDARTGNIYLYLAHTDGTAEFLYALTNVGEVWSLIQNASLPVDSAVDSFNQFDIEVLTWGTRYEEKE